MGEFADYYLQRDLYGDFKKKAMKKLPPRPRPSMLNKSQARKILQMERLLKEAKGITAAITIMNLDRWFPKDLREAVTRFNRKVK